MKRKTFLDDEFYMKSMVDQVELAEHWGMSETTISSYITQGKIKKNKLKKISMSTIMKIEELGVEELEYVSVSGLMRENNKLKQENERLEGIISEFKVATEVILGGN